MGAIPLLVLFRDKLNLEEPYLMCYDMFEMIHNKLHSQKACETLPLESEENLFNQ